MKKMKIYGLVGVAALAAVGGTFAYYSATAVYDNEFDTTNYGTSSFERFNPSDGHKWEPGVEVDKEVYATNTGEGDVWVRIKLSEAWTKKDGTPMVSFDSANPNFNTTGTKTEFQVKGEESDALDADKDGKYEQDNGTVVYKDFKNLVLESETDIEKKWFLGTDGYYYYTTTLTTGDQTEKLLDSVTLCTNTDMGLFKSTYAYMVITPKLGEEADMPQYPDDYEGHKWVETTKEDWIFPIKPRVEDYEGGAENEQYKIDLAAYQEAKKNFEEVETYKESDIFTYVADVLDDKLQGYANADYTLDISVEFVQADPQAADEMAWTWYPGKAPASN